MDRALIHRMQSRTSALAGLVVRAALLVGLVAIGLAALTGTVTAAEAPRVYAVEVRGVISQLTADQVVRVIDSAQRDDATAVLLQIDSPGGGEAAIREIVRAVLACSIPVVVWVNDGEAAQALSGALYITLAADIAAMTPQSRIGIALPTGLSDGAAQEERDRRIERAVQIATDASSRPRDPEMVSELVRGNLLHTAQDALRLGLIDFISPNMATLLEQIDGREAQTPTDSVTLDTDGARLIWQSPTWRERFLQRITDPNVAYVLFSVGALLLVWELFNPGRFVAGLPGVVALIVAFIAFGNMPISWLGLALLIAGVLLMIRELYTPRFTALGPLGVVLYLAGSFTLYRPVRQTSAIVPVVQVNVFVIVATIAIMVLVLLLIMRSLFRVRRGVRPPDLELLIGADAIVTEALTPRGVVRVHGQEWSALSPSVDVDVGEHVRVDSFEAGVLHVSPEEVDPAPLRVSR